MAVAVVSVCVGAGQEGREVTGGAPPDELFVCLTRVRFSVLKSRDLTVPPRFVPCYTHTHTHTGTHGHAHAHKHTHVCTLLVSCRDRDVLALRQRRV